MHAGSSCLGFQGLQAAVYIYMHACICVQAPSNCCGIQNAWGIWHDIQLADDVQLQKKTVGLEIAYRAGATS